jgi:hypothetical protein
MPVRVQGYHPLQCCNNKTGVVQAGVTKSAQKIYLAYHYNSVIITQIPAGLIAPKAFGVAEVEKPQSGGADCGYTFVKLTTSRA